MRGGLAEVSNYECVRKPSLKSERELGVASKIQTDSQVLKSTQHTRSDLCCQPEKNAREIGDEDGENVDLRKGGGYDGNAVCIKTGRRTRVLRGDKPDVQR